MTEPLFSGGLLPGAEASVTIQEWLATLNRLHTGLALADLVAEAHTFDRHFATRTQA